MFSKISKWNFHLKYFMFKDWTGNKYLAGGSFLFINWSIMSGDAAIVLYMRS